MSTPPRIDPLCVYNLLLSYSVVFCCLFWPPGCSEFSLSTGHYTWCALYTPVPALSISHCLWRYWNALDHTKLSQFTIAHLVGSKSYRSLHVPVEHVSSNRNNQVVTISHASIKMTSYRTAVFFLPYSDTRKRENKILLADIKPNLKSAFRVIARWLPCADRSDSPIAQPRSQGLLAPAKRPW